MKTYHCEICCENRSPLELYIEHEENGAIGLYCEKCKDWIRWITKEEEKEIVEAMLAAKNALEEENTKNGCNCGCHGMRSATAEERECLERHLEKMSKPTGNTFGDDYTIVERLSELSTYLGIVVNNELNSLATSPEDMVRKGAKVMAYQEMQKYVDNIIAGRVFTDDAK